MPSKPNKSSAMPGAGTMPPGGSHLRKPSRSSRSHHRNAPAHTSPGGAPDQEASAITHCLVALKGLLPQARQRVFAYVGQRYGMNIPWPAMPIETQQSEATGLAHSAGAGDISFR